MANVFARFQVRHLYPILPLALFAAIAAGPMRDNSFLWHVRAGTEQLASTRVLTTDPFSYTAGGEAWRTQSWLAELLYAQAESLFNGIAWAPVMVAIVGTGILGVTGLAIYRNSPSTITTAIWLVVAVWLLAPFAQPRPVIFSYLLLAILVLALMLGTKVGWAVIPLLWIWAGIHGSWVIGIGLVVLEAFRRRSPRLGGMAAVALVMTTLTAHGLGTWGMLVTFARSSGALEYIQEWQPPDFADVFQAPYLLVVAGVLVAAVRGKIETAALWVILPFMLFGLTTVRAVPVAALVLLPFAARSVSIHVPRSSERWSPVPAVVAVLMLILVVAVHSQPNPQFDAGRFPRDEAIEAAGDRRFFHDFAIGGYLIYRDGPEDRVYIDDRAELYGVERFAEFTAAARGEYEELFDRLGMEAAIVKAEWPLRTALKRDGWSLEYEDDDFEVLVRAPR